MFHDSGRGISDPLETCQRSSLMREFIVAAQQEELVQAFTNKAIALIGENGLDLYRSSFSNREQFEVEWQSRSTSGILRIAANRPVTLENVQAVLSGENSLRALDLSHSAVDLDIRMADQNLSKTPLGPAFSLFCDEK